MAFDENSTWGNMQAIPLGLRRALRGNPQGHPHLLRRDRRAGYQLPTRGCDFLQGSLKTPARRQKLLRLRERRGGSAGSRQTRNLLRKLRVAWRRKENE